MNDYNRVMAQRLWDQISGMSSPLPAVEDLQLSLSGFVTLFENDGSRIAEEVDRVVVALEQIRFSFGAEEQILEVLKVLEGLCRLVEEKLSQ